MEIICNNCQKRLVVPDEKLPEGKAVTLRCPGCKTKITLDLKEGFDAGGFTEMEGDEPALQTPESGEEEEGYDASEKPFDFLEEEGNTAMICESDPEAVANMKKVLELMDYHVTVAENLRDALRNLKYHAYNLILVNETFDGSHPESNGLLIYLERLNMQIRRHIFVGLLTSRFPTKDNMAAFLKSVNITINIKDLPSIDYVLSRGLSENDLFYTVYKESMKKAGRV